METLEGKEEKMLSGHTGNSDSLLRVTAGIWYWEQVGLPTAGTSCGFFAVLIHFMPFNLVRGKEYTVWLYNINPSQET